jgi:hypothetical protein
MAAGISGTMVAVAAELDKISERVKRGKVRQAKKGRAHGGIRPFGMPGMAPKPVNSQGRPRRSRFAAGRDRTAGPDVAKPLAASGCDLIRETDDSALRDRSYPV